MDSMGFGKMLFRGLIYPILGEVDKDLGLSRPAGLSASGCIRGHDVSVTWVCPGRPACLSASDATQLDRTQDFGLSQGLIHTKQ